MMNSKIHMRSELPYYDIVGRHDDLKRLEDAIRSIFKCERIHPDKKIKPAKGFYKDASGLRILYSAHYGNKYSMTEFPVPMDAEAIITIVKAYLREEKYTGKHSGGDGSHVEGWQILSEEFSNETFLIRKVTLYYSK